MPPATSARWTRSRWRTRLLRKGCGSLSPACGGEFLLLGDQFARVGYAKTVNDVTTWRELLFNGLLRWSRYLTHSFCLNTAIQLFHRARLRL
jgi:hypothetical protein